MRNVEGPELFHILLVQSEELAAGRQVVIHHIENLIVHPFLQSREGNRFRTVIQVSERNGV